MSLTAKYGSHLPFLPVLPFSSKKTSPKPSSKPFDETLIRRLDSLLPIPGTSQVAVPLSWLSRAADILALTLSDAGVIISDPAVAGSDDGAIAAHLDSSVTLLDACNAFSAEIDHTLRSRLLLRLACHLLSPSPSPESLRRAKSLLSEWFRSPRRETKVLIRLSEHPRGKISVLRRAIYAVEVVSCLVSYSIAAVLGIGEMKDIHSVLVSGEFPWAASFNRVLAAVAERVEACPSAEAVAVEAAVRRLTVVMEGEEDGREERIEGAAKEMEKKTEEMAEQMEQLGSAVARLFRAALGSRSAALQSFRLGPQKCK